jgi:hypothetical protein
VLVPDAITLHPKSTKKGTRSKMNSQLSLRFPGDNPNHHLWNNNGTWWCHYTVHLPDFTKRRVRVNLHTDNPNVARMLRDGLFHSLIREAA